MAYFEDLSPYSYLSSRTEENAVNIGWLDNKHDYAHGKLPTLAIEALFSLCANPVNRTRGYHNCPFCQTSGFGFVVERCGQKVRLGSAEIRTQGSDKTYVAPDMLYHYVTGHDYLPPDDFVTTLIAMDNNKVL